MTNRLPSGIAKPYHEGLSGLYPSAARLDLSSSSVIMPFHLSRVRRRNRYLPYLFVLAAFVPAPTNGQSTAQIAEHLQAIEDLAQSALEHSRAAEAASSEAEIKRHADSVFASIWGYSSGLASGSGAAKFYGWKTRWQSDLDDFELETPEKFGTEPAEVTDPAELGIIGRGLYARELLFDLADQEDNPHHAHVIASLSNVIGWMRMDYADARGGMPRVDLTAHWDAPSEFWQSTSDTGWIRHALAQSLNLLKVDYEGDVATARAHAADLTAIIQQALEGVDADGNGSVDPAMMEGGLSTALQHAGFAGIIE
jgi:hypothetical protein